MTLPRIPARLDLTARSDDDIEDGRSAEFVQGQDYVLDIQILDDNGDPFDCGLQANPNWTVTAQVRSDYADNSSSVLATFTGAFTDAPTGQVRLSLTSDDTEAIRGADTGRWDVEMVNKTVGGDSNYRAGFTQRVFNGRWSINREVTA